MCASTHTILNLTKSKIQRLEMWMDKTDISMHLRIDLDLQKNLKSK